MTAQALEDQRLIIQTAQDSAKSQAERNRLGQFATPTKLARAVVRTTIDLLETSIPIRFLDPAVGTGSFFSALLQTARTRPISRAVGYEIDAHYGHPASDLWKSRGYEVRLLDFTRADAKSERQYNVIVCNPPYVRHHHLSGEDKSRLQRAVRASSGINLSGLAGLYCYFMGLAHGWLAPEGVAAWLVPSEFMDVNYGAALKEYLLSQVTLLRIHRFDPNETQFDDALVSSAVVWFRKTRPPDHGSALFTFGGSLENPKQTKAVMLGDLRREAKWTRFPASDVRVESDGVTIGDLFSIKRGLATGANSFFIVTAVDAHHLDLPLEFLKPILPSPRYLQTDEVLADSKGNPVLAKQLFLIDCREPEGKLKKEAPALWRYFQSGREQGLAAGYLCSKRSPWYSQEIRPPSPFLCTYIGRGDAKSGRPFRFIWNHSQATAANVYLFLYPKTLVADGLKRDATLARNIWKRLNAISPTDMLAEGRVYGGGLHKLEPGELAKVPAGEIAELLPKRLQATARQLILCEEAPRAGR